MKCSRFRISSLPIALFMVLGVFLSLAPRLQGQQGEPESLAAILQKAGSLVGTSYLSGGATPSGFDCSGFVVYLYKDMVADLPRLSRDMARTGTVVEIGERQPGDLMFYATGSDPNRINHVAIWMGENRLIHSISDGPETGVVVTAADARYWRRRFKGSRRVLSFDTIQKIPPPELMDEPKGPESPWNDFNGILRGDFAAWKQQDQKAFEEYKRENG